MARHSQAREHSKQQRAESRRGNILRKYRFHSREFHRDIRRPLARQPPQCFREGIWIACGPHNHIQSWTVKSMLSVGHIALRHGLALRTKLVDVADNSDDGHAIKGIES